jgi:hypothetical protein
MQTTSFWDTVQQVIRLAMQFAGGWLVSKGILTEELAAQLAGGILSVSAVLWWVFWEKNRVVVAVPPKV